MNIKCGQQQMIKVSVILHHAVVLVRQIETFSTFRINNSFKVSTQNFQMHWRVLMDRFLNALVTLEMNVWRSLLSFMTDAFSRSE